jgi:23S rRNA (adenine2030-N6)-methyltransferase
MNYRHAYHAGNFADVVKHIALVAILNHLKKKETPFAVIDTHAGRGLYDLKGDEAARTDEASSGIGRLRDLHEGPAALLDYLALVKGYGVDAYPGSPLLAARLKRPGDRLVAIEKHPEDEAALARALAPFKRARAVEGDGYKQLVALLPPPERRGLVLIDPPYEQPSEFSDAAQALIAANARFATGIFLVWFPIKSRREADSFCGEVVAGGLKRALRIDFDTAPSSAEEKLHAAGLFVVNPPFGFEEEMRAALSAVEPFLGLDAETKAAWRISAPGGHAAF